LRNKEFYGKAIRYYEVSEEAEVSGKSKEPVQPLWKVQSIHEEIWDLQNMFSGACAQRRASGSSEGIMVTTYGK
jgi:hypothetical protein